MKFTLNQAGQFGWDGLRAQAYNSAQDFPNASGAYFEVTGRHGKVKSTKSDRIYYVIEGAGEFTIANEIVTVSASDVIIVPKNTEYDYRAINGTLKLFLVHTPAYDPSAEIKLE